MQRVVMPGQGTESWTVLGDDDMPVGAAERFLVYLTAIGGEHLLRASGAQRR